MSSSGLFSEERVANISEIMPKLSEYVQIGDKIYRGLEGDPRFPYANSQRPEGTVMNIHNRGDGLVDLDVKLDSGEKVTLAAGSIAEDQVWEFSEDTFKNVLERTLKSEQSSGPEYRGTIKSNNLEVVELRNALEAQIKESNEFNQTIVKTLNEMAKDIVKINPSSKFCSVFANEYRGAMID